MPSPILNFNGIPFPGVACNCAPPDTNGEVGHAVRPDRERGLPGLRQDHRRVCLGPVGIATSGAASAASARRTAPATRSSSTTNSPTAGSSASSPARDERHTPTSASRSRPPATPPARTTATASISARTSSTIRSSRVWPDAYYMSMNVFNSSGTAFLGPQPFAFDRAAMLAGNPATFITTGITGGSSEEPYLPADLDGSTLPPAGAPELVRRVAERRHLQGLPLPRRLRDPGQLDLHPVRAVRAAAGFHAAVPDNAQLRAPAGHDRSHLDAHRRPADVPARLPQLRRLTKRWWATSPSVRAASRASAGSSCAMSPAGQ